MTNEELIAKFNPDNARNLNDEDLKYMRTLTNDQLRVLAEAYPNTPTKKHYLVLYDSKVPANKQLYNLSSWLKLYNLRKFSNLQNWQPFTFWDIFQRPANTEQKVRTSTKQRPGDIHSARRVVDLSAEEAGQSLKKAIEERQTKKAGGENKDTQQEAKNVTGKGQTGAKKQASRPAVMKAEPAAEVADNSQQPADQQIGDPEDLEQQ